MKMRAVQPAALSAEARVSLSEAAATLRLADPLTLTRDRIGSAELHYGLGHIPAHGDRIRFSYLRPVFSAWRSPVQMKMGLIAFRTYSSLSFAFL